MITDTSNPDVIERELEQTRMRLGGHLDELQAKFSPGQLVDEGLDYLRRSQGADFFRNLGDSAAERPLPLALIGIGLTWLMAGGAGPRRPIHGGERAGLAGAGGNGLDAGADKAARARRAGEPVARMPDETEEAYDLRVNMARGYALGLRRSDGEDGQAFGTRVNATLSGAGQRASDAVHGLGDRAGDMASGLAGSARAAGDSLSRGGDMARRAGSSVAATMGDNPMLLGVFGLAAGALLAALLPQSAPESRALGGVAARAGDAARDAAADMADRGGRVASAAMQAGRDAARNEGLTPDGAG